jgi:hypothetical protein
VIDLAAAAPAANHHFTSTTTVSLALDDTMMAGQSARDAS